MDTLTELAIKYGTDKWGKHHYTPVYYDLFKNKREAVKKVLEIGSAEGAGVRMFRDFFPNATIYGAEIENWRLFTEERIQIIECDQTSLTDIHNLLEITGVDIDLVVDDGSHKPQDQLFTFLRIFPALKEGAIYVIEDVADESIAKKMKKFKPQVMKVGKRYDDRLIICRK